MKFLDSRRAGWDTETTGPNPTEARIVTAAIVARGGGAGDRIQTWLINPGIPIPAEATAVHGIDKQYDRFVPGSGQRKLKPTAERYGIDITDWHTADADADAALRIAEAQFERYPQLNNFAPRELYVAQQLWRGAQQNSLQEYFRRTDPKAVVDPGWPLLGSEVAA